MTPFDLYNTYRSLSIPLMDGTVISGIDVHEYRIDSSNGARIGTGRAFFDKLVAAIKKHCKSLGPNRYQIILPETSQIGDQGWTRTIYAHQVILTWPDLMRPFIGKGTPDDIRMAIRLAVHFKLLPPEKSAIQKLCDQCIGLDCSGFAQAFYGIGNWKSITTAYYYWPAVESLDLVRAKDALVWASTKHVAVIDSIVQKDCESGITYCLTCRVVESADEQRDPDDPKDGLAVSDYLLLFDKDPVTKKNFIKVMRPMASAKNGMYVSAIGVRRPPLGC